MRSPHETAQIAQMACVWEVCAAKPGNVTRSRDFKDTSATDFLLSAIAVGDAFESAAEASVGETILDAVTDTRTCVQSNTNLGIVLLLAPLLKACARSRNFQEIRRELGSVLRGLSVEDARLAYSAIRLAKAGGMGKVRESDVSEEPSITLLEGMQLARHRDSIASEYATDFSITFEIGLPALKEAAAAKADLSRAIVHAFLTILSRVPDTLISRKKDVGTASQVSSRAAGVLKKGGIFTQEGLAAIEALDRWLRDPDHVLNPGTTADLTTASIFLFLLENGAVAPAWVKP